MNSSMPSAPPRRSAALGRPAVWAGTLALLGALAASVQAAPPADLFFSESIEGTSNNKALEIYNGTGSPVNLAAGAYSIQMFFNGSSTAGLTINLVGTVAAGDVFVLAQASAGPAMPSSSATATSTCSGS